MRRSQWRNRREHGSDPNLKPVTNRFRFWCRPGTPQQRVMPLARGMHVIAICGGLVLRHPYCMEASRLWLGSLPAIITAYWCMRCGNECRRWCWVWCGVWSGVWCWRCASKLLLPPSLPHITWGWLHHLIFLHFPHSKPSKTNIIHIISRCVTWRAPASPSRHCLEGVPPESLLFGLSGCY